MLRDCYPTVEPVTVTPALPLRTDPVLAQLDHLLDDATLFERVNADFGRRWPPTLHTGRPSTPVAVVLRLLFVKRLYGWSYAETTRIVGDSLSLRQFCRLGRERVPERTTLLRWGRLLQPQTLQTVLDHSVHLAQRLQVSRGRKLRVDSTVVPTTIHYPTDSSLLVDSIRTLGRLLRRARPLVAERLAGVRDAFRTRTRSARHSHQAIHRLARRKGEAAAEAQRTAYRRLCRVATQVIRQAERVQDALAVTPTVPPARGQRLHAALTQLLPVARRVLAQTERRVLHGEAVPAAEKVVSIVEPHTAIITRHKAGQAVEFGRKVWLAETDGGIITDVQVLAGAPPDSPQVLPSLTRHQRQFGRPPDLLTGDRGCSTPAVRAAVAAAGVRRVILPHTGRATAASRERERPRGFARGYRWRAGIEGRIGVLKQVYGLRRCPDHGDDGLQRWVYLGVVIANLVTIAHALERRNPALLR